jgi:hypothetical protein
MSSIKEDLSPLGYAVLRSVLRHIKASADYLAVSDGNPETESFGPEYANVVVADVINRRLPKGEGASYEKHLIDMRDTHAELVTIGRRYQQNIGKDTGPDKKSVLRALLKYLEARRRWDIVSLPPPVQIPASEFASAIHESSKMLQVKPNRKTIDAYAEMSASHRELIGWSNQWIRRGHYFEDVK